MHHASRTHLQAHLLSQDHPEEELFSEEDLSGSEHSESACEDDLDERVLSPDWDEMAEPHEYWTIQELADYVA